VFDTGAGCESLGVKERTGKFGTFFDSVVLQTDLVQCDTAQLVYKLCELLTENKAEKSQNWRQHS